MASKKTTKKTLKSKARKPKAPSQDVIVRRILCDTIWIKRELEAMKEMLGSLGARSISGQEFEPYTHVDNLHRRPGESCDNG